MELVRNVPFFCIMLSMFSGILSSVLPGKVARRLNAATVTAVTILSAWLLQYLLASGIDSYTYMMGHFPAPWGNELRVGVLEAGMALFFSIIMLLSLLGGRKKLFDEVEVSKHNIYYFCATYFSARCWRWCTPMTCSLPMFLLRSIPLRPAV